MNITIVYFDNKTDSSEVTGVTSNMRDGEYQNPEYVKRQITHLIDSLPEFATIKTLVFGDDGSKVYPLR